ncbi:MAG: diaminopimelate epimerase [Verrucomicrobium sp.]|nr:diaminopimelate epimerase [Verrucomicrobium sp.]
MKLPFVKMTGAGNDFVMVDNRALSFPLDKERIAALCDRRFGIGADGLLAVEPGAEGADFRMRYYNADGGEAEMCGNGARCFAQYVRHLGAAAGQATSFLTPAGRIEARYEGEEIQLTLTPPQDWKLSQTLDTPAGPLEVHSVNTGVPHAVVFVPDVAAVDVATLGAALRRHAAFAPKGTNANFVQVTGADSLRVRTFERGVEGETLACGTGVVASALLAHRLGKVAAPVRVTVEGRAILTVGFQEGYQNVTLQGPALVVYTGEISWN